MKDYVSASELAQDEDFIRWVKHPIQHPGFGDAVVSWVMQNPEKKEMVDEAKLLVLAVVSEKQFTINGSKRVALWNRIDETINSEPDNFKRPSSRALSWYSIAATISLIVVLGVWQFQKNDGILGSDDKARGISVTAGNELVTVRNDGDKEHVLILNDGSKITLQPNSSVGYSENFEADRRDVYLSGEAFFDVKRDPKRPFSVHANELVTQVLGTSFKIRAFKKENNITVAVKTGKVSVFKEGDEESNPDSPKSVAAFLTRNQQIVYQRDESKMVKSLVEKPEVLLDATQPQSFVFTDEPIDKVFSIFEKAYGVEIVYDKEVMSGCYMNASLEDRSFYDQLRLICKGINATYEVLDTHIIITGTGCH